MFSFCWFDYYMSWCILFWFYSAWDSLCFLNLVDFSHVRKVFSYYVFKYFLKSSLSLFSFWDPNNGKLVHLMLFKRSLKLSSSFKSFFFFFCSVWVISSLSSSSLIYSSVSSNLGLTPSSVFLIPVIVQFGNFPGGLRG